MATNMINSVLNEGVRGLQNTQREMQRAAQEIASANIRENPPSQVESSSLSPVNETVESSSQRNIAEPLIELRRQEQLFTANAKVIDIANEALGSLLDVKS